MKIEIKETQLISVIVPVYNAEKTLRDCVDSILNQEYKNFEILLVDDGSKDSSPSICDEYASKDERVKVFHKPNGGVSSARNLGIDYAKGEWITFVDSDDYISESYFDVVYKCNYDLITIPYRWVKDTEISVDHRTDDFCELCNYDDIRSFLNNFLTTMIFRAPSALFFKKELLYSLRYNETMKVGEDTCFVHEYLLRLKSIYCSRNSFYNFRLSSVGASVKYNSDLSYAVDSLYNIYITFAEVEKKWGIDRVLFMSYISYFKLICKDNWKDSPSRWYENSQIKTLYQYVWPSLSLKQKLRLVAARILRR